MLDIFMVQFKNNMQFFDIIKNKNTVYNILTNIKINNLWQRFPYFSSSE